jgi:hypothetical protein
MFMGAADSAYGNGFNQDNFSYTKAWFQTGGLAPPTMKADTNALIKLGVNERLANVITGASLWSRAFGHSDPQIQGQGISGTVSAGGFSGQAYADWVKKGGWFHSDKTGTDHSPISASLDANLDRTIDSVYKATAQYAKVLGLPVEAVNGYSTAFKVVWGKTEEENQAALQAAMTKLSEGLAGVYGAQLSAFQKAGEALSATLERLAGLQVFTNGLNSLGGVFTLVAGQSVDAREQLIQLAGGMDALSQQAQGYVQNYYDRDEIAGVKAKDIQAALRDAGFTGDLSTRDDFRALVEGTDPGTEAGRKKLATLLGLQGSFASITDYLAETGQSLNDVASQAPAASPLSPLLDSATQQLEAQQQAVEAQLATLDATLAVRDAVMRLTDTVASSGGSGFVRGYRQPEITLAP